MKPQPFDSTSIRARRAQIMSTILGDGTWVRPEYALPSFRIFDEANRAIRRAWLMAQFKARKKARKQ